MIKVLKINRNGTALVNTNGRFRVVAPGEVIGELLERFEADAIAGTYDRCNVDSKAEVIDYAEAFQRRVS